MSLTASICFYKGLLGAWDGFSAPRFITSNFHDIFHRRLLQFLQKGWTRECAEALHHYGFTREFFTDQMPALRQPLQLEDSIAYIHNKYMI